MVNLIAFGMGCNTLLVVVSYRTMKRAKQELAAKTKELEKSRRRISVLDGLFKKTYEDNASGKLSDERFEKQCRQLNAIAKKLHKNGKNT